MSLFIHPSVDEHLGHFHRLAIVNKTAMNTCACLLFLYYILSGIHVGLELLGHMVYLTLYLTL